MPALYLSSPLLHEISASRTREKSQKFHEAAKSDVALLSADKKKILLTVLEPELEQAAVHSSGNYAVQVLLKISSPAEQNRLGNILLSNLSHFAFHTYACRCLQTLLEYGDLEIKQKMKGPILALIPNLLYHQNGNHVFQKLLQYCEFDPAIVELLKDDFLNICKHRYGARCAQRILENAPFTEDIKDLISVIEANFEELALDFMGNYVVQHYIQFYSGADLAYARVFPRLAEFACDTYGSVVVEKMIIFGTQENLSQVIEWLEIDENRVPLLNHRFGNFVIQRVLENSVTGVEKLNELLLNDEIVTPYASHVLVALQSKFDVSQFNTQS